MMMFILMCAQVFSLAFRGLHGEIWSRDASNLPGGRSASWFRNVFIFILAFFLDWFEIAYIIIPMLVPIAAKMGVDMIWLGDADLREPADLVSHAAIRLGAVLPALIAPPEITTGDIYRGIVPCRHHADHARAVFFFPVLALWLPKTIGW